MISVLRVRWVCYAAAAATVELGVSHVKIEIYEFSRECEIAYVISMCCILSAHRRMNAIHCENINFWWMYFAAAVSLRGAAQTRSHRRRIFYNVALALPNTQIAFCVQRCTTTAPCRSVPNGCSQHYLGCENCEVNTELGWTKKKEKEKWRWKGACCSGSLFAQVSYLRIPHEIIFKSMHSDYIIKYF